MKNVKVNYDIERSNPAGQKERLQKYAELMKKTKEKEKK